MDTELKAEINGVVAGSVVRACASISKTVYFLDTYVNERWYIGLTGMGLKLVINFIALQRIGHMRSPASFTVQLLR